MKTITYASSLALFLAASAAAQAPAVRLGANPGGSGETDTTTVTSTGTAEAVTTAPEIRIKHIRPYDQRGITVFEASKNDDLPYQGFHLDWGAAFNQPFQ